MVGLVAIYLVPVAEQRPDTSEGFSDSQALQGNRAGMPPRNLPPPKPSWIPMLSLRFPSEPGFLTSLIFQGQGISQETEETEWHDVARLVAHQHFETSLVDQNCLKTAQLGW